MTLALIQPVTWMPVARCDVCGQDMPADHRTHINSEAAPEAPGAAADHPKEITHG
jgi:hypothetical protein